ncbi:MAG: AI-2E family transporter [Gammaproteobacteria bacterium]|nr:MAG: AI-2E family transporter [Gammaproteobacteria bacterium]
MSETGKLLWLAALLAFGWLLWLLAPVFSPFALGALLAYLGDPAVDRLEEFGLSRTLSVALVFLLMFLLGICLLLILIPLLEQQLALLFRKIPVVVDWFQATLIPWLLDFTGMERDWFNLDQLRQSLTTHWQQVGMALGKLLIRASTSGQAIVSWLAYLVLVPVVTFYLLRDWDHLVARIRELVPRRHEPVVSRLARECHEMLAQFLRGQLTVMLILGVIYSVGLTLAGIDLALLIGMLSGLVSFVPYLGVIVGMVVAGIAALIQYHDLLHLALVGLVFGIGQAIEGMVLSPLLVGERIGLHPVAVIFAVMAGGQLFGFFGVIAALPVAAVLVVLLRHLREVYLNSRLYLP